MGEATSAAFLSPSLPDIKPQALSVMWVDLVRMEKGRLALRGPLQWGGGLSLHVKVNPSLGQYEGLLVQGLNQYLSLTLEMGKCEALNL